MPDSPSPPTSIADLDMPTLTAAQRPQLGALSPVAAFRAIRLGALGSMAGSGLNGAVYLAGRRWAQSLPFSTPPDLLRTMTELRLGIPRVVSQSADTIEIE